MDEGHAFQIRLSKFLAGTLRGDEVAGGTIAAFDRTLAVILGQVIAVVTPEAPVGVLVTDETGMRAPVGLHLGKEIRRIDLLGLRDQGSRPLVLRIGGTQRAFDLFLGFLAGGVFRRQRSDDIEFRKRNRLIDAAHGNGLIHGIVGTREIVRGPIVAIHAVHGADGIFRGISLEFIRLVNGDLAFGVGHAHPRDVHPLVIQRDELDFVGHVHVRVDAFHRSVDGIAAAHFEHHLHGKRRVLFVGEEMAEGFGHVAEVFLRPVAGLAGFLGEAQVGVEDLDRPVVIAYDLMVELFDTVDLGVDVGGGSRADVTGDTIDLGMRGMLIGFVFGFHRCVAGLTTKRIGFHQVIGFVAAEGGQENEGEAATDKADHQAAVTLARQVHMEDEFGALVRLLPADFAGFQNITQQDRRQAQEQEYGGYHVAEDPHVGIRVGREQVHRK